MRLLRLPILLGGSVIGASACVETPSSPMPTVGTPVEPPPVIAPAPLQWPTSGLVFSGFGGLEVSSPERPFSWRLPTMDNSTLSYPAWSPDGNRVAFSSNPSTTKDDRWAIHVLSKDGTRVRLSPQGASDIGASWSPDGRRIAFLAQPDLEGREEIYVMDADGSNRARVTNRQKNRQPGYPAWSPDGRRIAYSLNGYGIYVINPDGTDPVRLTPDSVRVDWLRPAWSPDGRRLAFLTADTRAIGFIDADGTNLDYLPLDLFATDLAWSPDGERIAFNQLGCGPYDVVPGTSICATPGRMELWMIQVRDGTLNPTGIEHFHPAWVR